MTTTLINELALLREAARRGAHNRPEQEAVIAEISRLSRTPITKEDKK